MPRGTTARHARAKEEQEAANEGPSEALRNAVSSQLLPEPRHRHQTKTAIDQGEYQAGQKRPSQKPQFPGTGLENLVEIARRTPTRNGHDRQRKGGRRPHGMTSNLRQVERTVEQHQGNGSIEPAQIAGLQLV